MLLTFSHCCVNKLYFDEKYISIVRDKNAVFLIQQNGQSNSKRKHKKNKLKNNEFSKFIRIILIFQFKDFLQLYNKLTEKCFLHCTDNFFTRELSTDESNCLDKCVLKFSNVNQRVMNAYVHDQAIINERRMKEMEEQMKANEAAALAAASAVPATEPVSPTTIETNISTSASSTAVTPAENPNQNHTL